MSALSVPKLPPYMHSQSADTLTRERSRASQLGGGPGTQGARTRSSYHWTERSTVARSRGSSSSSQGRDDASAKSLFMNPFGFDAKTSYNASGALLQCRSDGFELPKPEVDDNIWKRPPPDFRPQCYAPRPPKRNSRDAMQPWKYGPLPSTQQKENRDEKKPKRRPVLFQFDENAEQQEGDGEEARFVTDGFAIPNSFQARLMFAREGMNKAGPFEDPKHHDFRGYPPLKSLGLDEFDMKTEHDPMNLRFKTQRIDIIHGLPSGVATDRDTSGRQMAPPLPIPPQWEDRLILPSSPWPKLSGEYTRHRRVGRSPHSALMERIEERLSHDWAQRKLEEALRRKQAEDQCAPNPAAAASQAQMMQKAR